jgi:hypothetical protein
MFRTVRRAGLVAAGAAALVLAGGTAASAHHCYVEDWNDAAYQHLSQGGTAWMPLSDLADLVLAEEVGLPQCVGYGDVAAEFFMEAKGLDEEPLIHSRATVGGGAKHIAGIEPAPFDYLDFEVDGPLLDAAIGAAVEACLAG